MGSPIIFNGAAAKLLKSILKFFNGTQIQAGSGDPTSVAVDGEKGDIYISTATGFSYQKNDSGVTTNWTQVGTYDVTDFTLANMTDIASATVTNFGVGSNGYVNLTALGEMTVISNAGDGNSVETLSNTTSGPIFNVNLESTGDTYEASNKILMRAASCDTSIENAHGFVDSFIVSNSGVIQGQFYAGIPGNTKHAEVTAEHNIDDNITHSLMKAVDGTDQAYIDVTTSAIYMFQTKGNASNYIDITAVSDNTSNSLVINISKNGVSDVAGTSLEIDGNGIARSTLSGETSFTYRTNHNATLMTELVYGQTQQKFTGTAPAGSVAIDKNQAGSMFFIRNSTLSTINFIQNTDETFNGAADIDIPAGKTAQFVQFGADGEFTVFVGP